jgi:hypothetical protein
MQWVNKFRTNYTDQAISEEVGFDVVTPAQTSNGYKLYFKTISANAEKIMVSKAYKKDNPLTYSIINISIIKYKAEFWDDLMKKYDQGEVLIEMKVLEWMGVKVYRRHFYALKNTKKIGGVKPEIITRDVYYWVIGNAIFNIDRVFESEAERLEVEKVIEDIVKARS